MGWDGREKRGDGLTRAGLSVRALPEPERMQSHPQFYASGVSADRSTNTGSYLDAAAEPEGAPKTIFVAVPPKSISWIFLSTDWYVVKAYLWSTF